jgi:DNA-3-methyladenine glycosylase I
VKDAPTFVGEDDLRRCFWCRGWDPYIAYHDREWGRPVVDDRRLFEKIALESFQSGLSWRTILAKRENFRAAFAGFDFEVVARFDDGERGRLLADAGIVRHRGKIDATIANAQAAVELRQREGSLASFFWRYEPDPSTRPKRITLPWLMQQTTCPEAKELAKELKRRGFRFVGPTTAYAFMQAMGLVNDHLSSCVFRDEVEAERARFERPR